MSVAGGIGFISMAEVLAKFGVIMLMYLKNVSHARLALGHTSEADLLNAILEGAVLRVWLKAMTVAVIIAGLVPIMIVIRERKKWPALIKSAQAMSPMSVVV